MLLNGQVQLYRTSWVRSSIGIHFSLQQSRKFGRRYFMAMFETTKILLMDFLLLKASLYDLSGLRGESA